MKKNSASLRLCVRKTTTTAMPGVRALARSLHRSPSHICRVLKGQRKPSDRLARGLARMGITCTVDGTEFDEAR